MSTEEAADLMDSFERKWNAKHKREFLGRMEHKLSRKERNI
jgi:hypothetical protein